MKHFKLFEQFVTELNQTSVSGTKSGWTTSLEDRKYELTKDVKGAQIGDFVNVLLPKGTIIYNLPGGLFADHFSLKNKYASKSSRGPQWFDKPTFNGIQIRQKPDVLKDIEKHGKVLESVVTEAKRGTVYKAAKKGSYPAVIVVIQNGKVIHQEPVSTPDVAPATFNVMQEKYPRAELHLEDKTGKRLFSESVNEAKVINKKTGKDITKHLLDFMEKKITKEEFEKLTGLTKESVNEAKYNDWDKSKEEDYTDAVVDYDVWFPGLDSNPKFEKTWYDRIEKYDYKGLATFINSKSDTKKLAKFGVTDIADFAKFVINHV